MQIYDIIRKKINKAVSLSGRSRMRVARDAGVSYPNLCRFINGKRDGLGIDVLVKLSKELNVPVGFFFGESDAAVNPSSQILPDGFTEIVEEFNGLSDDDKRRVEKVIISLIDSFK